MLLIHICVIIVLGLLDASKLQIIDRNDGGWRIQQLEVQLGFRNLVFKNEKSFQGGPKNVSHRMIFFSKRLPLGKN